MVRELLNIMHSVYVNACACEARSESAAKCQSQPTQPLKSGYISHSDRPDSTDLTSTATTHHSSAQATNLNMP